MTTQAASELDSARKDAQAGTATLEQRPCPALGARNYLRGLSNPQQLVASADRERTYEDGALLQLQQIARDPQLSSKQRPELQALASWSIAASVANWSMLQLAQQALADPLARRASRATGSSRTEVRRGFRSRRPSVSTKATRSRGSTSRCGAGGAVQIFSDAPRRVTVNHRRPPS